ncbi:hypothetical protein [Romboutsia sp. 1001713B170131_170501_G6]|uniref:hypothetical protein n=1 Tax=Romboutsia sp. 1001713B170131_170501_G6 TaxID=2787108 RepID=UPI0018ABDD43|nr:hypothetical protein [Romboutsia sp. 1001713B170131_170501_G6]
MKVKKEICSKMAKDQGYTDCIYIKTNNKEDDLIWLNKLIEESKEREKAEIAEEPRKEEMLF